MNEERLIQLTVDYESEQFPFSTFLTKLNDYPQKIDIFNQFFVQVPNDIQSETIEILLGRIKLIYKRINRYVNFESNLLTVFQQIDSAVTRTPVGKHSDIFTRELWCLHEYKNSHNKGLNAKYFSTTLYPVMHEMLTNNLPKSRRGNLILEKTNLTSSATATEHVFPVNLVKKLLYKFYHIAIQKNYSTEKIYKDFIDLNHILFIIGIIPESENQLFNRDNGLISNMPDDFYEPTSSLFMNPWARYIITNIRMNEFQT